MKKSFVIASLAVAIVLTATAPPAHIEPAPHITGRTVSRHRPVGKRKAPPLNPGKGWRQGRGKQRSDP